MWQSCLVNNDTGALLVQPGAMIKRVKQLIYRYVTADFSHGPLHIFLFLSQSSLLSFIAEEGADRYCQKNSTQEESHVCVR